MFLGYVFPVWYGDSVRRIDEPPMDPWAVAGMIAGFLVFVVVVATVMERSHGRWPRRTPRSG